MITNSRFLRELFTCYDISSNYVKKKKSNLTLNIFTLKTDKKTYFDMESIVCPYENILEGPGNYLSLSMNDYTDVLIKIK